MNTRTLASHLLAKTCRVGAWQSIVFSLVGLSLSAQQSTSTDSWACTATTMFQGTVLHDHLGTALSAVGDWNGDGIDDVLIGGTVGWDDPSLAVPGRVELYLGTATGACSPAPVLTLHGADSAAGGECFGYDVAFIGDLDFDGKDDFCVGSPRAPLVLGEWKERGRVYFYLSSVFPASGIFDAECANTIIEGEQDGDRLGTSIAEVGDFDGNGVTDFDWGGDGLSDIPVGAPGGINSDPSYAGRVYVLSGFLVGHGAIQYHNCEDTPWVWSVNAVKLVSWLGQGINPLGQPERRDRFGWSVAVAGEIGDPYCRPEVVVGAPQFLTYLAVPTDIWGSGYVRVMTRAAPPPSSQYPCEQPGPYFVQFDAGPNDSLFGFCVGGQINLDGGGSDILIGIPGWDRVQDGQVRNDTGRVSIRNPLTGTQILSNEGKGGGDYFGFSVLGLGRFNGSADAVDFYAIGASRFGTDAAPGACANNCPGSDANPGDDLCGRAYEFKGTDTRPFWTVTGEKFRDSCGWTFSRVGNLGGPSSLPEFITSAPRFNDVGGSNLADVGRIYLFTR